MSYILNCKSFYIRLCFLTFITQCILPVIILKELNSTIHPLPWTPWSCTKSPVTPTSMDPKRRPNIGQTKDYLHEYVLCYKNCSSPYPTNITILIRRRLIYRKIYERYMKASCILVTVRRIR
jgi:hypothetical protein